MAIEQQPARFEEAWPGPAETSTQSSPPRWYHKAAALLYVFFCFELGVFLLLFPWLDFWQKNYFSGLSPGWYELWTSPYLRGAVSGLGLINIGISFTELLRLRRFSRS